MEKEFEALEIIGAEKLARGQLIRNDDKLEPYIATLKQALIELKQIKEAKPSEALECWNWLNATLPQWCREKDKEHQDTLAPIKQALLKTQVQEKENAYIEKVKTMLKQKDCVLRYVESEDCFAVKTMLSGWYKLTPQFVDNNVREEIKPLPAIEKIKQLKEENAEYKEVLNLIFTKQVDMFNLKVAIDNNSLRLYNNTISKAFKHLKLTQKEFDLLKRWCKK